MGAVAVKYGNEPIKYREGYKYQLAETYSLKIPIRGYRISTEFISLDEFGKLTIKAGYAWDGPSGPTLDTRTFMKGSLIHDALYQLIRNSDLPISMKETADMLLYTICVGDGMMKFKAWIVLRVLRRFGYDAATKPQYPVVTAP